MIEPMIEPGTNIGGRYVVEGVLGAGAMARVYRVRHIQLGTEHALKVLMVPMLSVHARLLQEGRIQAAAAHPNIVAVSDVVNVDDKPGLVMELIRGPTLEQLLSDVRLSFDQCDDLAAGVIAGVAAAHEKGLIHRDLKPANILVAIVNGKMVPKVADFGLAKLLETSSSAAVTATRTGMLMGTPAYMAPEQARDSKSVDVRADVFALGVILYEMVTGVSPFARGDMLDTVNAVVSGDFRPPAELVPSLPARMERAILGALKLRRDERIPSCAALLSTWHGLNAGSGNQGGEVGPWSDALLARYSQGAAPAEAQSTEPMQHQASGGAQTYAPEGEPDLPSSATLAPTAPRVSHALQTSPAASASSIAPTSVLSSVDGSVVVQPRATWLPVALAASAVLVGIALFALSQRDPAAPPAAAPITPTAAVIVESTRQITTDKPVETAEATPTPTVSAKTTSAAAARPTLASRAPADSTIPTERAPTQPIEAPIAVVAPVPATVPAVAEASPPATVRTTAMVGISGDASRVWLQSAAGNFPLPAEVPPGPYQIRAAFDGREPIVVGDITLAMGESRTVTCKKAMGKCH